MRKQIGWRDEKTLCVFLGLGAGLGIGPGLRVVLDRIGVGDWVMTLLGIAVLLPAGLAFCKSQLSPADPNLSTGPPG